MKRLTFLELIFLFLSTTFSSNPPPPGWFQQTLPVSDFINDIFFLDILNGWVVTKNNGYILNTTNGGENWDIQLDSAGNLQSVQFLDNRTGYALGNGLHGIIYKTTNGGANWDLIYDFNPTGTFRDMCFINEDTGWICSDDPFDGGVFKTTNGGNIWQQQLNYASENPQVIFFTNKDTGWTGNEYRKLYKTTNGGLNWNLQTIFPYISSSIKDITFINSKTGFISAYYIYKTSNGGITWDSANDSGIKLSFANDLVGWSGTDFFRIKKTTNGGLLWFTQYSPVYNNTSISSIDSLKAWAGATGIVHTTDGGGLSHIYPINNQLPADIILYQNYPNPFNPVTNINYELRSSGHVNLRIFDATGKEVQELINSKQDAGVYKIEFNGSALSSSVYYYRIELIDNKSGQTYSESKKMLLVK